MSNVKDVIINNSRICNQNKNNIQDIYKELEILKLCIEKLENKLDKLSMESNKNNIHIPTFDPNEPIQCPSPSDESENLHINIKKL